MFSLALELGGAGVMGVDQNNAPIRGGRATSKVGGGPTKKGTFWKKGHLQWEISKRKYTIC